MTREDIPVVKRKLERLIGALDELYIDDSSIYTYTYGSRGVQDSIDELSEMNITLSEWIPLKKLFPPEGVDVLICYETPQSLSCRYEIASYAGKIKAWVPEEGQYVEKDDVWYSHKAPIINDNPDAWIPLPKLYHNREENL